MTNYAIVPVKHLATSKSRLAPTLTPENRKLLTLTMLADVLTAIRDSTIQRTVVVGSNSRVCELAINAGAAYINEKERGLNPAIGISIKWCIKQGADSILVIPADIPLLSPSDIDRIIELAGYTESVAVLSPSENGGTNALYLRPPNLFPVSYGSNSFKRHIGLALGKGIPVKVYHSSSVAFDIDCQSDLQRLLTTLNPTLSKKFVARVLTNNEHRVSFSREKFFVG